MAKLITTTIKARVKFGSINNGLYQVKFLTGLKRYSTEPRIIKSSYPNIIIPEMHLHQHVFQNVHKWPNHTAIQCGKTGKRYSYIELYSKCKRFAASLKKIGLKKGESIAIALPNIIEYPVVVFGSMQRGVIPSTINPDYGVEELRYHLNIGKSRCVVCHPSNLKHFLTLKKTEKEKLILICTQDTEETYNKLLCDGVINLDQLIENSIDSFEDSDVDISMSDTALISFSSGTTGLPKAVVLTHKNVMANMVQFSELYIKKSMETHGENQQVIPGILKFFHIYGMIIVLVAGLTNGSKIITLPNFNKKDFLSILDKSSNINLFLVPPLLFFLNSKCVPERYLRGIMEIMIGAAPCGANDLEKIRQKTNNQTLLSQAYGLTESSPLLTLNINEGVLSNPSSCGKLLSNTLAKVINPETGDTMAANSTGELCFLGPQVMAGYLNNPEATAKTIDSEGWLHTGDVGYYDEDGFFYITDRLKELIKVKGFQVAPAELEEVLRRHPGIVEAGVVGAPNDRTGELPVAFVQTISGYKVTEQEIKDFLASHLSEHKHLSSVRFLTVIPKTASGKILRKQLRQLI